MEFAISISQYSNLNTTKMLKTAWRSILKTKSLSAIHIIGLAIAIAASTVLFLTAMFELSFDNFHPNGERIALLYKSSEPETGKTLGSPVEKGYSEY